MPALKKTKGKVESKSEPKKKATPSIEKPVAKVEKSVPARGGKNPPLPKDCNPILRNGKVIGFTSSEKRPDGPAATLVGATETSTGTIYSYKFND
jgi:hypothetical protein